MADPVAAPRAATSEAAFELGERLVDEDRLAEAEQWFAHAAENGHGAAAHNLGVLLAYRGDAEGAEDAYRLAVERDVVEAGFELAELLFAQDLLA